MRWLIINNVSNKDYNIIKKQLGREPENLAGIARRCPFSYPAVIVTNPYDKNNGVFPTTYWLSCPYFVEKVYKLEDKGLLASLTQRMQKDDKLRGKIYQAHFCLC